MALLLAFMSVAKAEVVTIGDGTGTTYYCPFNSLWGYSFVEQVYTADEIGTAGTITAISFNMRESDAAQTNAIDVFMKNVSRSNFSGSTDWETVTASDMVFSGTVTFNPGWTTITLDTPFQFDGTSNLMIGMHEYTSGYSTRYFYYTTVTGGMISGHSDSANPDPYNMGSYSGTMYIQNYRANIQIEMTSGGEPATLLVHDGTATNNFIPAYGFYADAYLKAEFVYPATELSDMNGGTIDAMTFYASTPATEAWTSTWQVFMSEVTDASISSFYGPGTVVYEGALDGTGAEMTINFITPYQYNGGNLLVGIYNITTGNYKSVTWAGEAVDGASISGYNYSGLSSITATQRNFLPKTNFSYISSGGVFHPLVVMQNGEEINSINVGSRPNGYWMEPFTFQMRNKSSNTMVSLIDFTPQGYFSIVTPETPFNIARNEVVDIQLATGESTDTEWQMMVLYGEEPDIATWTIMAEPYDPACPDVWELAYDLGAVSSGFSYQGIPSQIMPTELHNDYTLPFPEIEEGVDAVYKFEVNTDIIINAFVDETAENSKVALYTEDFNGEGGPMATNNYTGLTANSNYYNNIIENLGLTPGTYYLVASSTDADFGVNISFEDMPCPLVDEFEFYPYPEDNATEIESFSVTLHWTNPEYATAWRLVFGTSYYPDPEHEQTIITEWNNTMTDSFTLSYLRNNTNYFWHVEFSNENCPEGVSSPVWGFTTHLNAPQNLFPVDYTVFNDETITLNWNAVVDRAYHYYNVYRDGELIGSTEMDNIGATTYTDGPLAYNMNSYTYYVTAVYDEGESAPSNAVAVYVSGYGDVNGYVYEQDSVTSIANATVTLVGTDEFGVNRTYNFTTNSQGYYSGHICAGVYNGSASCSGYQTINEPVQSNPITITYNETMSPIDYIMDEYFYPVPRVIAEYYPDAENPNSPYVKVSLGDINNIVYDFEDSQIPSGWTTIDGGSPQGYGWQLARIKMGNGFGHNASNDCILSQSYENTYGIVYPDNYLVSPIVNITDGCLFSFYACAQDSYYGAEHFGVFVSDDGTSNWTMVNEWTIQSKGERHDGIRGQRVQTEWMLYSVDLSAYAGQKYIAIRHFNCSDQFYLMIDDIVISNPNKNTPNRALSHYRYYRTDAYNNGPYTTENTVLLADSITDTEFIDVTWEDAEPGVYKWGVGVVYAGNRSEMTEAPIHWSEPVSINNTRGDQTYNFDDGMQGWTTIDGGSPAGYGWKMGSEKLGGTGYGHNGSTDLVISQSYDNNYGVIFPDNYLVSPQVQLGGSITFWACAQDASYGAEHFGVAVSTTSNTDASAFTMLQEWTIGAKSNGAKKTIRNSRNQTTWMQYTVDLSAYDGMGYVAIRHFNCSDMFYLDVDDITIFEPGNTIQEPRESKPVWSNYLEKNMYLNEDEVNITVSLNSGDSPEGVVINFTNLNPREQALFPIDNVTLDASGYYAWDNFRRGDYQVQIFTPGYETITEEVSIWDATSLNYVLNEKIYSTYNLYVSSTGWATWDHYRHFEGYQVVLSDTEDNMIYQGVTYNDYIQLPVEELVDGETYHLKVTSVYSSGIGEWSETDWMYQSCSNFEGVNNLLGATVDNGYLITWEYDNGESTRNGNSISTNAQQLCLEYGLIGYPASVNAGTGEEGPDYGCLYSRPNPSWYYLRIDNPGNIDINMYSDPSVDIDFCCWGPFDDPHTPCPYGLTEDKIADCSYTSNWDETCHIPETAQAGEYYILMLTNYSNQECNFYFQKTDGTGDTHCMEIVGYMLYRDGELLGMTTENSYFDEGGSYEHEYSVRVVYDGPNTLPNYNIYYSMSCPQTIGGAIYEVTVSADPEEYGVATGEGSYINGFPCTLTATPTSDYSFVNWTINGEVVSTDATYTFLVTEDSECVAHFTYIQETPLAAGWNWWSTYVEQEGINGLQLLENSLGGAGIRIQGKDASVDYFEYQGTGYWYGHLNAINNEQMYKIHTSETCNAMVNGAPAQSSNHPILINYGWNWMGYPVAESISVNDALSGLNAQPNDIIKGRNVSATYVSSGSYNEWYGTMNSLEPGQGYMYKSNDYNSKTLVFQTGRENGTIEPNITPADNAYIPAGENYADNMLITAVVEVNGEELRSDEYELAAFVGDECRGSVKLMYIEPFDRYVAFLLVFGDKEENLHFVLTDGSETGASREQITYTIDGLAGTLTEPVTLHFSTLGIDADQLFVNVYPNPSKGVFNIEGTGIQKVEVVNTYGQTILSTEVENDFLQINLGSQAAGTYLLRVVTANGTTTRRLVTTR